MGNTIRHTVVLSVLVAAAGCSPSDGDVASGARPPSEYASEIFSGNALFADVQRYADIGQHQTGTRDNLATAEWLRSGLADAGLNADLQPWSFRQFADAESRLTAGGTPLESYPFWFPHLTDPDGVSGRLVGWSDRDAWAGNLVFVPGDTSAGIFNAGVNRFAEAAAEGGAAGLIVVVRSASGEIAAVNASEPYTQQPLPLPAVIVASGSEARLARAVATGESATLAISGRVVEGATARNVVARLERGGEWVVVTTPISGWFVCAGERGPGVALFLALARWAASTDTRHSYLFLANSGHELDNLGAHRSMEAFAPPPEDVTLWIHLGASIATRQWEREGGRWVPLPAANPGGNLVGVDDLLPMLESSFSAVSWLEPATAPLAGELRHFIGDGYRAFGLFGSHTFFHTRLDTPESTDPALLGPVGDALRRVVEGIEQPAGR